MLVVEHNDFHLELLVPLHWIWQFNGDEKFLEDFQWLWVSDAKSWWIVIAAEMNSFQCECNGCDIINAGRVVAGYLWLEKLLQLGPPMWLWSQEWLQSAWKRSAAKGKFMSCIYNSAVKYLIVMSIRTARCWQ